LGRPAAGKTGTTNDVRDAWFLGFVPQRLVAGAWMGYDIEKSPGTHETGAVAALPIWLEFMKEALAHDPVENFSAPDGVVFVRVDAATGEPVGPGQPRPAKVISECFKEGTAPVVGAPGKGDAETRARGG
jgi:penicillin-binding protein 1A